MLTIQTKQAKTLWQKIVGLIGSNAVTPLFLQTRFGIHTFGMKQPIDVIILEKETVVDIQENIQPNRIFFWNPHYSDVLELPAGTIQKLHIKPGTTVAIEIL
ncbi:MAG TPA: DUF192 domain-containing protein [Patescibacteria group bacterium]|nr:DUF192 domain-containing protein [Patescibacteria group bacterium]